MTNPHTVIRRLLSSNHISFVQESNFNSPHALERFRFLCQAEFDCSVFTNDSGVSAQSDIERPAGKHGGLCTVLHADLKGVETAQHLLHLDVPDRYMVIRLYWDGREVYIHNVYAPAKLGLQQQFFNRLPRDFPSAAVHIVGGDFNAVLDPSVDSDQCHSSQIAGIQALNEWLCVLNVVDPWRIHHGDDRVYSSPKRKNRLDYILVSPELNDVYYRDSKYSSRAIGGDHLSAHLRLGSSSAVQRQGPWRVSQSTLAQPAVREWIVEEMDSLLSTMDSGRNPGLVYQAWKRRLRQSLIEKQQHEFRVSAQAVSDAERELGRCRDLGSLCPAEQIANAETRFDHAMQQHNEFLQSEAFYRQFRDTESSTSFFFRPTTTSLSRCPIDQVELADGVVTDSQSRVQLAHQEFWGSVFGDPAFASPADMHVDTAAQQRLVATITRTLSEDARVALDRPITEHELCSAIQELPRGKSPGFDGLSAEFYQIDPERMARILKPVFDGQLSRGILLPDQRISIVALLHKGKSRTVPAHYRPISLLSVDVKILSRVLTTRLREIMSMLIHPDQRGFVRGRHISHSLLLMYDLQDHVTDTGESAYATFVDAEKAFDRVNWDYMWRVLRAMGFGDTFVAWCQLLYKETRVRLNINGWLQDALRPSRGVKQGDPLSALLFVLTMEPLANLIRQNPQYGYRPSALGMAVTGSYFADDTTLISNSIDAAQRQLELVQIYCAGSGAKLNVAKTNIMSLNRHSSRIAHPELCILAPTDSCRYLGLPIGQGISHDNRVSVINERFFQQLARWKWRARTVRGRRLLAQAVLLSQLWYATAVTFVPNAVILSWQRAIDMYILRSSTSVSTEKRPIDSKWLYHRTNEFTLGLPHVHSILKRQRLMLLSQIVQDAESTTSFTWSTLARHRLDTTCGAFGRPGRHDYLWLNPNAKLARAAILLLPVWLRGLLRTWHSAKLAVDMDALTADEKMRVYLEAPLWMNRFADWHIGSTPDASTGMLPAPSDRRFCFVQRVAQMSKIFCLYDVYTTAGWPSADVFVQRVMLDFAAGGDPPPRRRSIHHLYLQLSALKDRAPASDPPTRTSPSLVPWPWVVRTATSSKRFPALTSKTLCAQLLPTAKTTSLHPLLRHGLLGANQLVRAIGRSVQLRHYLAPVYFDVRFRVWWYLLPVADKYGSASYRLDRYCHHGCRHIEDYRHVFFDCRTARSLWRVHFDAWKRILLGVPGWKETLFGMDLALRQPFREATRGAHLLWNIVCSIVFHTLWSLRNDKKHRSIDVPPIAVSIERNVRLLKSHIKAIHRAAVDSETDDDLIHELDTVASALHLTSYQGRESPILYN